MTGGNTLCFCFKENAKTFSKNSTTQENITILRHNLMFLSKTQKTTLQCFFWGNTKSKLKKNARAFSQVDTTQENVKISSEYLKDRTCKFKQ